MEQKTCSRCGQTKPLDLKHFPYLTKKSRWDSWCRRCYADRTREYNAMRPDERRSRDQAYYERTKETRRAYKQKYGKEYNAREATKIWKRQHHTRLKERALLAYSVGNGIACECCGETQSEFLTLDHKRNDGKAHRKAMRNKLNGASFYRMLERNGYPKDFELRVLCMNCNWARHWNNGICPHELARQILTEGTDRLNQAA